MKYSKEQLLAAFRHASNNREELLQTEICGCFSCMTIFRSTEIKYWYEDKDGTAECPYCGIPAIICEGKNYPFSREFIKEMNDFWFLGNDSVDLWMLMLRDEFDYRM